MIGSDVQIARPCFAWRGTSATAALVLVMSLPLAAWQGRPGSGNEARKESELDRSLERAVASALAPEGGASSSDDYQPAERIARLGPRAIPILFSVLATGSLPAVEGGGILAPAAATEPGLETAMAALALLPRGEVRAHLQRVLSKDPEECAVVAALRVIGTIGTAEDLPLALTAGGRAAAGAKSKLSARIAFAEALEALVGRDPSLVEPLGRLARGAPAGLLSVVARAIGSAPSEASLAALGELLGREPALEVLILSEIERTAARLDVVASHRTLDSVRRCLARMDPMVLVQACRATGTLGDCVALSPLIQLLSHPEDLVRSAAHEALARLSGKQLPPVTAEWQSWLEAEEVWWAGPAQRSLSELAFGTPPAQVRALQDLARGRIFRDQLLAPIEECLSSDSGTLPALACVVLGELASRRALPALHAAAEGPDPALARAARRAVARIRDVERTPGLARCPPPGEEGS